jgi:Holliday junction resolvasome RuvABC DNA-binding subunit
LKNCLEKVTHDRQKMIGKLSWHPRLTKIRREIIIDCHGVGYEVLVPMSSFYNLPELGRKSQPADAFCGA